MPDQMTSQFVINEHPAPGMEYYSRRIRRDEELQRLMANTENLTMDDRCGYWSITVPSLKQPAVDKLATAIRLMAVDTRKDCAYIEFPEVVVRFDFKQRAIIGKKYKDRLEAKTAEGYKVLRCENPTPEAFLLARSMADHGAILQMPVIVPASDPDAAITGSAWMADKQRTREEVELDLEYLKAKLLRISLRGLGIIVKKARNDELMRHNCDETEWRARGLLREMIGLKEFLRYMKRGFIVCKGRTTGHQYVIRGGHTNIDCYHWIAAQKKFVLSERICVQFVDAGLPHTDGVIMRKLFVENDEIALRRAANVTVVRRENEKTVPSLWPAEIGLYAEQLRNNREFMDSTRVEREELAAALSRAMREQEDDAARAFFSSRAG